jgi:hypothetical protein
MQESERGALDVVLVQFRLQFPTIRFVQPLRVRQRFELRLSDGCIMTVSLNGLDQESQLCNLLPAIGNCSLNTPPVAQAWLQPCLLLRQVVVVRGYAVPG